MSCFLNPLLSQIQYYLLCENETRHWNLLLVQRPVIPHWGFSFADLGQVSTKELCRLRSIWSDNTLFSQTCTFTAKSVQEVWSMVIEFHSKIGWVGDPILHSALSGWVRSSNPQLLPHQCRAIPGLCCWPGGCSWAGLMLCPEVNQHPEQTLQLWRVAQDSLFAPLAWLGYTGP